LTQAHETGDEQRRTGQERDRQGDLRAHQDLAEPLLTHAARRAAAAFLERIDQVRA
jgi:hypothetical protein